MTSKETLLQLLNEYNVALDKLRDQEEENNTFSIRSIAHQVAYLEQRILQLETQLSILDLNVHAPTRGQFGQETQSNLLARLNPWHEEFHIWTYTAAWAILLLTVVVFNIVSSMVW